MKSISKKSQLPSALKKSMHDVLSTQANYIEHRAPDKHTATKAKRYAKWLASFAEKYLTSRYSRAEELSSSEIKKARDLAFDFIGRGNHDFFVTCVDGRNMPTVMFSKVPHVGGALRAPAGIITGVYSGATSGKVYIDEESYVVRQIINLLRDKQGDTIFYGFDSHVGCAARGLLHSAEGGCQVDSGLSGDVASKFQMAQGLLDLRDQYVSQGTLMAEMIPTFFSFDPHAGGVIAGLELHLNHPEVMTKGYTEEVFKTLAAEGKILRVLDLFGDSEVLKELSQVIKPASADFRHHYAESILRNWEAITKFYADGKGKTFQKIYQKIVTMYREAGWKVGSQDDIRQQKISDRTLRQKSKFLLKNLLTRYSVGGVDHHWPFENHQEDLAVITEGGYAPFAELDAFSVFAQDRDGMTSNVKLTINLVRNFRRSGATKNPVDGEMSVEDFVETPVLISSKAVMRCSDEQAWEALNKLDLSAALSRINWDDARVLRQWGEHEVVKLIRGAMAEQDILVNPGYTLLYVSAIVELFERLRILMRDADLRKMIVEGKIVVLHTIVDDDRTPRVIVPLVV